MPNIRNSVVPARTMNYRRPAPLQAGSVRMGARMNPKQGQMNALKLAVNPQFKKGQTLGLQPE